MKKLVMILFLLLLPISVHASRIETFEADDFFKEARVGWNLGNSLDSHYGDWNGKVNLDFETLWGNPRVSKGLIKYVKESGFNIIRIPITWYYHTYKDDDGNYIIHSDWMNRVKEVVDYAYDNGMYVIINTHHDDKVLYTGEDDEDKYNDIKKVAASFWNQVAEVFKDYDEHLIFEAYNEIDNKQDAWTFGALAAEQVNELNQIFVDNVRNTGSNNRYRLLVISPVNMKNTTQAISAVVVPNDTVEKRIMLSVHMYVNKEDEQLDYKFKQIKEDAEELGLRVIISEFGTESNYTPSEHRAISESNYVARAYENGIITIRWDNGSDNFKIFDRSVFKNSNQELINALTNPTKYTNPNGFTMFDQIDQFYYKRLTGQGQFDEKNLPQWWGTWTNEELIAIPSDMDYLSLSVYNRTDAGLLLTHGVYYYDLEGNFLSSKLYSYPGYEYTKFEIPENAAYFRFVIYNSKVNTKLPFFQDAVENGNYKLMYGFYKKNTLLGQRVFLPENETPNEDNNTEEENTPSEQNEENKTVEENENKESIINPKTGSFVSSVFVTILAFIMIVTVINIKKYSKNRIYKI